MRHAMLRHVRKRPHRCSGSPPAHRAARRKPAPAGTARRGAPRPGPAVPRRARHTRPLVATRPTSNVPLQATTQTKASFSNARHLFILCSIRDFKTGTDMAGARVHPMHGPNRFKLGVFSMNSDGGLTLTKVPERW